jgi:hypothetical protein
MALGSLTYEVPRARRWNTLGAAIARGAATVLSSSFRKNFDFQPVAIVYQHPLYASAGIAV